MSDTRWRQLIAAVAESELNLSKVVIKFIDHGEQKSMNYPPSLDCPRAFMDTIEFGPVELRAIEWMSIPADISPVVKQLGKKIPIESSDGTSVILGYRR